MQGRSREPLGEARADAPRRKVTRASRQARTAQELRWTAEAAGTLERMSPTDDEQRALRARLEELQAELARSQDALMTAQLECKRLQEELDFARWSLEGGEPQGLKTALAKARAEAESLRRELRRVEPLPRPAGALQVVLMGTADRDSANELPVAAYVGFVVDRDRTTRDVVRTRDVEFARAEVERVARELNVPVEDLT